MFGVVQLHEHLSVFHNVLIDSKELATAWVAARTHGGRASLTCAERASQDGR